jgi:hypothetical protein
MKQSRVNASSLAAEDQNITSAEGDIEERVLRFAVEQPAAPLSHRGEESFYVIVNSQLQSRPVVHRAATKAAIAQHEA